MGVQCHFQKAMALNYCYTGSAFYPGAIQPGAKRIKPFPSKNGLNVHRHNVHGGIQYKCEICDKDLTTKANRAHHLTSNCKGKRIPCEN